MDFFKDIAQKYGLPFTLLCLAIWWLHSRLEHIENRLAGCEADKFKIITENNERSNAVIEQCTYALERNTETLQGIQSYLGIGVSIHKKKPTPITAREGIK